jgi:hypothetical protein
MEKLIKEIFKQVDILYDMLNRIGQIKAKKIMRKLIANYFNLLNIKDFGIVDEYLTLFKKLKYSFGKNCIKKIL